LSSRATGGEEEKGEVMDEPNTDYVIHLNGKPVATLSVADGEYYTVPDTAEHSLTLTSVELFDPDGVSLVRFAFAQAFAFPKGESGILSILEGETGWGILYYACNKPDYLEEHRDMYAWDEDTRRLRAADWVGDGQLKFKGK
jgi:hypothetical protein